VFHENLNYDTNIRRTYTFVPTQRRGVNVRMFQVWLNTGADRTLEYSSLKVT